MDTLTFARACDDTTRVVTPWYEEIEIDNDALEFPIIHYSHPFVTFHVENGTATYKLVSCRDGVWVARLVEGTRL